MPCFCFVAHTEAHLYHMPYKRENNWPVSSEGANRNHLPYKREYRWPVSTYEQFKAHSD